MDAKVLVVIIMGETKPCDDNLTQLRRIFASSYFEVQTLTVPLPGETSELTNSENHPERQVNNSALPEVEYIQNHRMAQALAFAAEGPYIPDHRGIITAQKKWANLPVLIIKDSSVVSDGDLQTPIATALTQAPSADLFFLCKWLDACDKYTDLSDVEGYTLKWSLQPTATQAIVYRPAARDYFYAELPHRHIPFSQLLNEEIAQGNIRAAVFVPNLVHFDMSVATSNTDYNKLNQCATTSTSTTSNKGLLWTIVTLIVLLIVAWISIQILPRR